MILTISAAHIKNLFYRFFTVVAYIFLLIIGIVRLKCKSGKGECEDETIRPILAKVLGAIIILLFARILHNAAKD